MHSPSTSGPETLLPRYTRPVPDEWPELIDFANELLIGGPAEGPLDYEDASDLVWQAYRLENEPLERCKYYGYGEYMRWLLLELENPTARPTAVDQAAHATALHINQLDEARIVTEGRVLRGWRLEDIEIGTAMDAPAHRASARLSRTVMAVTDAIVYARAMRAGTVGYGLPLGSAVINSDELREKEVGSGGLTRLNIIGNFTSGPSRIIDYILEKKQQARHTPGEDITLSPLTVQLIDGVDAESLAGHACALRSDEVTAGLDNYCETGTDGIVRFMRSKVPKSPPRRHGRNNSQLYDGRLICAALQVEGMVPLSLKMISEIGLATQALLNQRTGLAKLPLPSIPYLYS